MYITLVPLYNFYLKNLPAVNMHEAKKNLDKPLLRRKSDLPTDILTQKSLETYQVFVDFSSVLILKFDFFQRADEYLTTPGSDAQNEA